jgi:hypothetical protein
MCWNKKTHEQFILELNKLVGDEYTVLDKYENSYKKIKVKHNKCLKIYDVMPYQILNGRRCPYCYGKKLKTHEQFMEEIADIIKDEFTILGKYINYATKIKVKHNICGHIQETVPQSIKQKRCPKCSKNLRRTTEQYKKDVFKLVGKEFTVIGEYKNIKTKVKMKHTKCNKIFEVTPTDFLHSGNRCSHCFKNKQKTHEEFLEQVKDLLGEEYTVLGKYVKALQKVKMKHNKCGHVWNTQPASFLFSNRCPKCNISKGETAIANWLKNKNIKNKMQYKIKDCKNKLPLPFDFAIFDKNNSLALIEYQGEQHYRAYNVWGGQERLEYIQTNDKIKKEFCEKNNIKLIVIPYWDLKNIDEILENMILS